eukprot:751782-Hanusia_phi.AAC.3
MLFGLAAHLWPGDEFASLACGRSHSLAVNAKVQASLSPAAPTERMLQGETFAWGCGKNGRLGLGVPISHQQPCLLGAHSRAPCALWSSCCSLGHLRGVRVVEVACGSAHSLALDEDGGLWGWSRQPQDTLPLVLTSWPGVATSSGSWGLAISIKRHSTFLTRFLPAS